MSHTTLDARNLNCPLPILRTKKALNTLGTGETLEVLTTDPGAVKDMEIFCQQTGNTLVSADQQDAQFNFIIRKT